MDGGQDRHRVVIGPVVDDVGQQVAVGSGKRVGEEVSGLHADARLGWHVVDDLSVVEQDSARLGCLLDVVEPAVVTDGDRTGLVTRSWRMTDVRR